MENIIQASGLTKYYGKQTAVCHLDLHVEKGQIYALLGPNGSGKSTIINLLSTCIPLDEGQVLIDHLALGSDNHEIRKRTGVVFQNGVLDDRLTVEENLFIRGSLYGLQGQTLKERIVHTAHMTGTFSFLHRPYGVLSGGQKRRADIARALLPLPKLLFLDEPTTGLDPEIRADVWMAIQKIKAENDITILLTTHYLEEASQADQIAILDRGQILASGTPAQIREQFSDNKLILFTNQIQSLQSALNQKNISYQRDFHKFTIFLSETLDALPILNSCHGKYSSFEVLGGTMDDAYLSILEGGS